MNFPLAFGRACFLTCIFLFAQKNGPTNKTPPWKSSSSKKRPATIGDQPSAKTSKGFVAKNKNERPSVPKTTPASQGAGEKPIKVEKPSTDVLALREKRLVSNPLPTDQTEV